MRTLNMLMNLGKTHNKQIQSQKITNHTQDQKNETKKERKEEKEEGER